MIINATIKKYIKDEQLGYLSTSIDNKPKVRAVSITFYNNLFWFCTLSGRKKINEIDKNPNVEICWLIKGDNDIGSIRISGDCFLINDIFVKEKLSKRISFFHKYWNTPKDKNFTLFCVEPNKIIIQDPNTKEFKEF